MPQQEQWDAPGILAEIKRRGETLTSLARKAGLNDGACRTSLTRAFPAADKVISKFLGVSLNTLWPDRYTKTGRRIDKRTVHYRANNKRTCAQAHCQIVEAK